MATFYVDRIRQWLKQNTKHPEYATVLRAMQDHEQGNPWTHATTVLLRSLGLAV